MKPQPVVSFVQAFRFAIWAIPAVQLTSVQFGVSFTAQRGIRRWWWGGVTDKEKSEDENLLRLPLLLINSKFLPQKV